MTPTTILLGDALIAPRRDVLAERLGDEFRVVVPPAFTDEEIAAAAAEAEVIVAHQLAPSVAVAAKRLRLLQLWIAGVDHLNLTALGQRGITVATAHENARTVAELALAHVLAGGRGLALGDRKLRQGDWSVGRFASPPGRATYGATVGLIGYGAIGRAFAELSAGLGYRLLAVKRHPERRAGAERLAFVGGPPDLPRVLGEADFVIVTLPLTRETAGLLDAGKLALMKSTAWLILVSRQEVVDEEALYQACRDRRIAGAGIDVWRQTPPPSPRLPSRLAFHELDNVVMTPHCAGWTREAIAAQMDFLVANLRRFRRGEPLAGLVDLELGY